jgi:cyclophilin family peptidyl-prolyl cis-trans isomerase
MKKFLLLTLTILSVSFLGSAQTKKPATTKKPEPKHTTVSKPKDTKPKGQRVEISTDFGVMIVRLYDETPLHRDNFIKLVKQGFYDSLMFHRVIKSFMIQGGDPTSKHADSNAMLGAGDIGYKIPAEFNPSLYHKRGALAAARDNNPQQMSSGCQFYIVQGKTYTMQELEQIINSRNMSRKQEILYSCYQSDTVQAAISALQNSGDKELVRQYMEKLQVVADDAYKSKYPNAEKINNDQILTYNQFGGTPHLDGAYTVFGEIEVGWEVLDKIANSPTRPGDRPVEDIRMKMRLIK